MNDPVATVVAHLALAALSFRGAWAVIRDAQSWLMRRIESRYRREMTEAGMAQEQIDADWERIAAGKVTFDD